MLALLYLEEFSQWCSNMQVTYMHGGITQIKTQISTERYQVSNPFWRLNCKTIWPGGFVIYAKNGLICRDCYFETFFLCKDEIKISRYFLMTVTIMFVILWRWVILDFSHYWTLLITLSSKATIHVNIGKISTFIRRQIPSVYFFSIYGNMIYCIIP